MNDEINGLGSYFSKDYVSQIGLQGVKERFANLVPVIYNELQDIGEDTLMAMGIETEDDVNGLFWPLLKSTVSAAEEMGVPGIETGRSAVTSTLAAAGENPLIGAGAELVGKKVGAIKQPTYDPNVEFEIVPEKDPKLKQQQQQKQQRIQQQKRFF
jgi:hypothetical protein